jgi:hypothetical protein
LLLRGTFAICFVELCFFFYAVVLSVSKHGCAGV